MSTIVWEPADRRPPEAGELEEEIRAAVPDAEVRLTLRDGVWVARALRASAMCARGPSLSQREAGAVVAEVLRAAGLPARA